MARFRCPRAWSPVTVPLWPVEVDWTHPLAQGLVSCYVPGSPNGLSDITGIGPPLVANAGTTWESTPVGAGLGSLSSTGSGGGASATAVAAQKVTTAGTLLWRGVVNGYASNNTTGTDTFFGISYTTSDTSPWLCISLDHQPNSGATPGGLMFDGNNAGSFYSNGSPAPTNGVLFCGAVSATFGGTFALYQNGASVLSGATGSAPSYSTTSQINLGTYPATGRFNNSISEVGMLWSRALSDTEHAWLNAEPYVMLRPIVRRMSLTIPPTYFPPLRPRSRAFLTR